MQFSKEFMIDVVYDDHDDTVEVIYKDVVDTTRWSILYEMVFKVDGKYYKSHYSVGATENQDEGPYDYEGDMINVTEVQPKEVLTIKYVPVKEKK